MMSKTWVFIGVVFIFLTSCDQGSHEGTHYDVLVLGGGTGGTAAAIAAAQMGMQTAVVEPTAWLGGMLTAAGVSAIDGNHHMPAGLWGRFRQALRDHYGGAQALATGWVSHTQFEPHIGARILSDFAAAEESLMVFAEASWSWETLQYDEGIWSVDLLLGAETHSVTAEILIDGTDLGDVAAAVGCGYDYGMESRSVTGEQMAPEVANTIIQDFTYAAVLKDFGKGHGDHLLSEPKGYEAEEFLCACDSLCQDPSLQVHPCATMMSYAKLPGDKYMINWPLQGNDYYADLVMATWTERDRLYEEAKQKTLRFIYFIQHELGYRHLGLADDEFPSEDRLPLIPYHREGRRIHGEVRLTVNEILQPYANDLYRTGIAVGDYPIDHHHAEHPDAPEIDFPPVPSFSIPMGALIPVDHPALIMADKAISVSNIANGSTRLQPVVLQIGTAAGFLAAHAVQMKVAPSAVPVRTVQATILEHQGYLVPSYDVDPRHQAFAAIQKTAAVGLLKGRGEPYAWANRTWYDPDSTMHREELQASLALLYPKVDFTSSSRTPVTETILGHIFSDLGIESVGPLMGSEPLTRAEIAVLLDETLSLFEDRAVASSGKFDL
ncbi:MAG: FAD-dependent oxidoreductase [Saprospiraceae bacterium]|nr:FAD-dependent oxidoreductase [Saprospiraceae bacterium]